MSIRKFAADDGNLNSNSIITIRNKNYSDINLLFNTIPGTGNIPLVNDAASVKQAVRNIILTNFGERPFKPHIGANLRYNLFENINPFTLNKIEYDIENALNNYEPRIDIISINTGIGNTDNTIEVTLKFKIIATQETVIQTIEIERLR